MFYKFGGAATRQCGIDSRREETAKLLIVGCFKTFEVNYGVHFLQYIWNSTFVGSKPGPGCTKIFYSWGIDDNNYSSRFTSKVLEFSAIDFVITISLH